VRSDVCARLGFLGIELDAAGNSIGPVRVVVVHAREDVVAARLVRPLL